MSIRKAKGKLNSKIDEKRGKTLNSEQIQYFINAIKTKNPNQFRALCFIPRNAVVFYDKTGKITGFVNICFECGETQLRPEYKSDSPDLPVVEDLFKELGLKTRKSLLESIF